MNYPIQQQGYGAPQGYPPAAPGYPVQQGYAAPPQGYAPPQQGYGPPQGYGAPPEPAVQVSLEDFLRQPASSGQSLNKAFPAPGSRAIITIARNVSDADVQPQTDMNTGKVRTYRDGRVMSMLVVPVLIAGHPAFPDGRSAWYVKGQIWEELIRAMQAAGVQPNAKGFYLPEANATCDITRTQDRPVQNMSPQHTFAIIYTRPEGAAAGNGNGQSALAAAGAPVSQGAPTGYQPAQGQQQYPAQGQQQYPVQGQQQFQGQQAQPQYPVQGQQAQPQYPVQGQMPGQQAQPQFQGQGQMPGQQAFEGQGFGQPQQAQQQYPVQGQAPPPAAPASLDPAQAALLQTLVQGQGS